MIKTLLSFYSVTHQILFYYTTFLPEYKITGTAKKKTAAGELFTVKR